MSTTDSRTRSLVKALSWRIVALCVTAFVTYLVTGSYALAASVGLADSAIKIFAYYLHERTWENVNFGRPAAKASSSETLDGAAADDPLGDEARRAA